MTGVPAVLGKLGSGRALWSANLLLVAAIVLLDWLTPAGIVVGILLSVPILATSAAASRRVPFVTFATATVGFVAAALFGRGPIAPQEVWLPNRVLVLMTLPAAYLLARSLQVRRQQAERARDEARGARDVNRLLVSLLAHDLRAPLAMAVQALDYAGGGHDGGSVEDRTLLDDVQIRLRRSLGTIDQLLRFFADGPTASGDARALVGPVDVRQELEAEADAYRAEAERRRKRIRTAIGPDVGERHTVDVLVLRQAVRILLDNALRHARPGEVVVQARVSRGQLHLAVSDAGALIDPDGGDEPPGAGVGLALCRALVARAGGDMETGRVTAAGSTFAIRLPLGPDRD